MFGNNPSSISFDLRRNLVGYWRFDETNNNDVRLDSSINGNNFTNTSGIIEQTPGGLYTNAATWKPVSGGRLQNQFSAAVPVSNMCFTLWYKPTTNLVAGSLQFNYLFYGYNISVLAAIRAWDNDKIRFNVSSLSITSSVAITTNIWNFIAAQYDYGTKKLSIRINNNAPDITTDTVDFVSAFNLIDIENDVLGIIYSQDEQAFWNRVLTTNELNYIYNGGVGRTYSNF